MALCALSPVSDATGSGIGSATLLAELGLLPLWVRRSLPRPDAAPAAALDGAALASPPATPAIVSLRAKGRWDELAAEVASCRACGLCETRQQTVFGVGALRPEWLFVGEAPGAEEDARGEPFVGQAGKLLDNMLAALDLSRAKTVYIANVLKCRPPGNRDPSPEEVTRCSPYLREQIGHLAPRIIVALGRFAAQTLLGSTASLSQLRGRVHRVRFGEVDYPVVATYHPSYLLRTPEDKRRAWVDLCLAQSAFYETEPR